MGTNYLGHFALTCLLGGKIKNRVISVGSASYMFGRIRLDDLNRQARKRSMFPAYADSKLAIMLFVHELARRGVRAYVADPGAADTDITRDSTGVWGRWVERNPLRFPAQDPHVAARTTIQAVTTDLPSGTYIAPRSSNFWAHPRSQSRERRRATRTWPSAMGTVRRADRLRLDSASPRADATLENKGVVL